MRTADAAAHPAAPFLQTDGTAGGRGSTVQTTVIEKDPLPAVIHHAHVLPEETEDNDPSHPAASPRLPHVGIGAPEDTHQCRGLDLGLRIAPVVK